MSKEIYPNYIPDVDLPEPDPNSPVSQFLYGPIDGRRVVKRSLTLSQLNFVPLESVSGKNDIVATINASGEGLRIASSLIKIDGSVEFSSGYNPTEKVASLAGQYNSSASGPRVRIFPDVNTGIQVIDDLGKDVLKAIVGGVDVGDVVIGDYAATKGCKWDKSAGTFKIKGNLEIVDGYANISDKPTQLANINATEGSKLTGIESGADVTGTHIAAGISGQGALATLNQVTTTEITDNSISTPKLQAGAVTALKISVGQLSAISADVGLLTAGTLRGVQIETAASGQRIIFYSTLMAFYNSSNENVASIYAGLDDLLIKNQLTTKNIFIDAGSGGYVTLGTGGTIRMQVGASVIECRQGVAPYTTDSYALGLATKRWTALYLKDAGIIYFGGSYGLTGTVQTYSGYTGIKLTGVTDIVPQGSGIFELGYSTNKWYRIWGTVSACDLPTKNSAVEVFKKIKKPVFMKGHLGEKQYFKEDEFPEEMKMINKDGETSSIEVFHTLGVTVQAVRELIEKVEKLEQKVEPK